MSCKRLFLIFAALAVVCGESFAAKPQNSLAALAPEVFSVKIDYANSLIIAEGQDLDPASAAATLAGVTLSLDGASSATTLVFPFTEEVSAVVNELGNYVLKISTDGGSITLTVFIPFALVVNPPPPPPGADCPCSPEWDDKSATYPPGGFRDLTPYCSEDSGNFVTVQFYDQPHNNYWVLWTEWLGSEGYCELWIDGPSRALTNQDQFSACAGYLRGIVTVWGSQGNECLF